MFQQFTEASDPPLGEVDVSCSHVPSASVVSRVVSLLNSPGDAGGFIWGEKHVCCRLIWHWHQAELDSSLGHCKETVIICCVLRAV